MTHLDAPRRCDTKSPAPMGNPPPVANNHFDGQSLRDGIAVRRQRLLELELAYVAACETEAARSHVRAVRMDDRTTWDHATWDRYLDAAARLELQYGPAMRRLLRAIDQLERILALLAAMELAA